MFFLSQTDLIANFIFHKKFFSSSLRSIWLYSIWMVSIPKYLKFKVLQGYCGNLINREKQVKELNQSLHIQG